MDLQERPNYNKSNKLRAIRSFLCKRTQVKKRHKTWIGRKLISTDKFYSDSKRAKENVKRVIDDERTPLARDGEYIINTEVE